MSEVLTTTLLIASGMATRYDPDVMGQVYQNRLRWGHVTECPECLGRVALLDCSRLDERVWLRVDGAWVGPVHVVDCAAGRDRGRLEKKRFAVDLGWLLARWLGVIDDVKRGVGVRLAPPHVFRQVPL